MSAETPIRGSEHFVCPDCGPHVKADEDWCCSMCGADCKIAVCSATPACELERRLAVAEEALQKIAYMGMTSGAGYSTAEEEHQRQQAWAAISIAARALTTIKEGR